MSAESLALGAQLPSSADVSSPLTGIGQLARFHDGPSVDFHHRRNVLFEGGEEFPPFNINRVRIRMIAVLEMFDVDGIGAVEE